MFYLYAIGSMLGFAVQGTLLAHYARKLDGLSLGFYRGTTFMVTLAPLLIGSSMTDIRQTLAYWPFLLISAACGGTYLGMMFTANRFLPVGIVNALTRTIMAIIITAVGWIFLDEVLSIRALLLIGLLIVSCLMLALVKNSFPHLEEERTRFAFILSCVSAIPLSAAFLVLVFLTRNGNPLVSGYFWELSVAAGCGMLIVIRSVFTHQKPSRISLKTYFGIALCSAPTLIGTGLYSMAIKTGPVAIVNTIGTGGLVIMTILAWWLYEEKMNTQQWVAITLVIAGLIGLRFV